MIPCGRLDRFPLLVVYIDDGELRIIDWHRQLRLGHRFYTSPHRVQPVYKSPYGAPHQHPITMARTKAPPKPNPASLDIAPPAVPPPRRFGLVGRFGDRAKLRHRRMVYTQASAVRCYLKRKKGVVAESNPIRVMCHRAIVRAIDGFENRHRGQRDGLVTMLWKGMRPRLRHPREGVSGIMSMAEHIDQFPNEITLELLMKSMDPLLAFLGESEDTDAGEFLLSFRNDLIDLLHPEVFEEIEAGLIVHLHDFMHRFAEDHIAEEKRLVATAAVGRPLTAEQAARLDLFGREVKVAAGIGEGDDAANGWCEEEPGAAWVADQMEEEVVVMDD